MAIAFRNASGVAYAGGGSVTIDKPSGVVDGDIMLAVIYHENDTMASVPENWALISHVDAGGASISSYWKRAASEGANYTWNATSNNIGGSIAAYSGGLASGSPIDTSSENTGTNSTLTWTGITTTVAGAMLIGLMMKVSGGTTADAATASAPLTNNERTDVDGTGILDGIQASAGSSGDKTVTLSGWIQWAAHLVALKPATGSTFDLTAANVGDQQVG